MDVENFHMDYRYDHSYDVVLDLILLGSNYRKCFAVFGEDAPLNLHPAIKRTLAAAAAEATEESGSEAGGGDVTGDDSDSDVAEVVDDIPDESDSDSSEDEQATRFDIGPYYREFAERNFRSDSSDSDKEELSSRPAGNVGRSSMIVARSVSIPADAAAVQGSNESGGAGSRAASATAAPNALASSQIPSVLQLLPDIAACVELGVDSDDDIGVELKDIQRKLPPQAYCAAHKLNLVATTDASRALKPFDTQKEMLIGLATKHGGPVVVFERSEGNGPARATVLLEESDVLTYQKTFNGVMEKLKAIFNLQSRSSLVSDVIAATLKKLFPVANATRWNSTYDAVKFIYDNYGRSQADLKKLNDALAQLKFVRTGKKREVSFTESDMEFLHEYIQVSDIYDMR